MNRIEHILIVGGGTSGWLSAAYLARRLGTSRPGGVKITLIESSEVGTVGVGEATIPPIRTIIQALGVSESEFMRESSATFKLAIRFCDWLVSPGSGEPGTPFYYHAFSKPSFLGQDLHAPYWVMDDLKGNMSFSDYVSVESRICDAKRGPKRIQDADYAGILEYAYHFDAGRLAKLLTRIGKAHGVEHLIGHVEKVDLAEDGSIAAVQSKEHGVLEADLYIDCTGFAAHMIEKAMGREFIGLNDILFCDRAVACQAPYADPSQPLPPYTIATAQPNGWTWDIPLNDRRGVGYVWSSKYTDQNDAEKLLVDYLGQNTADIKIWHLKMRVGVRREQWYKNCVAIGLSAGFIEPMESTGIYLVDIALRWLVDFLPPAEHLDLAARQFNERMNETYDDVVDFIKMHYCLSRRSDTDFWIDNRRDETLPDTLRDNLESWRYRVPGQYEFRGAPQVFGLPNYLRVMYGMDYLPDLSGQEDRYPDIAAARRQAQIHAAAAKGGVQVLPDHRALIDQIYTTGLQPAPQQMQGGFSGAVSAPNVRFGGVFQN